MSRAIDTMPAAVDDLVRGMRHRLSEETRLRNSAKEKRRVARELQGHARGFCNTADDHREKADEYRRALVKLGFRDWERVWDGLA